MSWTQPMEWDNAGTAPSATLKQNGFVGGYKPPAAIFNYFLNNSQACIEELQDACDGKVAKVTGKDLSTNDYTTAEKLKLSVIEPQATAIGKSDPSYTGGEIFNDYMNSSASGNYSHAEGSTTTASGNTSHAEGDGTTASGNYSHAEGNNTEASGDYSHAEGWSTTASDMCSHAEGWGTEASGNYSHAEGSTTTASGICSHADGFGTIASGYISRASGYTTVANDYQAVFGKLNKNTTAPQMPNDTTGSLFVIGCGTSNTALDNALRISAAGKCYGQSAFAASGADYAEYFEWADGNKKNADRRGLFVTLDGEQIKIATAKDDFILGVVSANPLVIGDVQSENWQGMYLRDVFGSRITETVEVEEMKDELGAVIPKHTEVRYKINPDFNPDTEYKSREDRNEWAAVGMLGKLIVVDDGTCKVNEYCTVGAGGKAKAGDKYRVLARIDDTHIKILLK